MPEAKNNHAGAGCRADRVIEQKGEGGELGQHQSSQAGSGDGAVAISTLSEAAPPELSVPQPSKLQQSSQTGLDTHQPRQPGPGDRAEKELGTKQILRHGQETSLNNKQGLSTGSQKYEPRQKCFRRSYRRQEHHHQR